MPLTAGKLNDRQLNHVQVKDVQLSDVQVNDVQPNKVQFNAVQSNAVRRNDVQPHDVQGSPSAARWNVTLNLEGSGVSADTSGYVVEAATNPSQSPLQEQNSAQGFDQNQIPPQAAEPPTMAPVPAPVLLAPVPLKGVSLEVSPASGVSSSTEVSPQSGPSQVSEAVATAAASANGFAVSTGAETLAEVVNGENWASSIVEEPGQFPASKSAPRFAASLVASPPAREVMSRGTAQSPTSTTSALPTGYGAGNELMAASQTPFSVFFSSAVPGTESAAASTLPRMILPKINPASLNNSSLSANATSGSAQSSGLSSSGGQNGVSQSSVAAHVNSVNNKNSSFVSPSESSQAAAPIRKDADLNTTNVTIDLSNSSTAPLAAATPVATGLAQPNAPALLVDSPPKATNTQAAAGDPATPMPAAPQAAPPAPVGPVQVAQMVNRVGQSEMRIGMNTSAFGSVEVRTVVHASDVGLVIGSEKGDLRGLLTNEMPALTNVLQQQNLKLNAVNFMQGAAFSNNGSGGGNSPQQQRPFIPAPASANYESSEISREDSMEGQPVRELSGVGGLSILA